MTAWEVLGTVLLIGLKSVLLLVALLLKVNLDGTGDARFFSGILGTLIILLLVLPLATRFYLRFQGGGLEGRSLMRDAEWSD